nr:UDP-N-acetylglucosamine 2-epimerase (non-hydrolyzing) [uncultured Pedobacter sp.]
MKILTIIGARPQFIKAAVISHEISKHDELNEVMVHTGQHFDNNMSNIFFEEMNLPKPKYHLDINSLGHGAMTGRMLEGIENILVEEKPDWVMVYGDTNSTIAGALAARKKHIKVAHVEAGLRSFNMNMPEEINRILTDRISNVLFCASKSGIDNLKIEGFDNFDIDVRYTGDVMFDAVKFYSDRLEATNEIVSNLPKDFILATLHREENTNDLIALKVLIESLNYINKNIMPVVIPIHPRTKKILEENNLNLDAIMIEPVGYLDMLSLLRQSKLIITDSGGLQKEAYFCKKPCVTMRNETEWTELVDYGYNIIAGNKSFDKIIESVNLGFKIDMKIAKMDIYGEGNAGTIIVDYFLNSI